MASDLMVKCVDCGAEFEFTTREQMFYQEKGWDAPRRCKTCRAKRHPETPHLHAHGPHAHDKTSPSSDDLPAVILPESHQKYRVNCSSCGVETAVPFKPDPKRPVFCKACLAKSKAGKR